ncbi:MAG: hypothetical protein LBL28_08865 [Treponema sp.]|jgi:hypothetical protein|nr:hypothetical protein [Treponema sp.]
MIRRFTIFGSLFFLAANAAVIAQEPGLEELLPGLKDRAVVLDIVARVIEQNQQEVWNSVNSKVTLPGRPVGLKLVGANVVVAVQFTPYFGRNGHSVLVAQGQIWVNIPNEGIRYQTTMQTIPLKFGEQIYFFPLGPADSPDDDRIEIMLELRPYAGEGDSKAPEINGADPGKAVPGPEEAPPGVQGNESP